MVWVILLSSIALVIFFSNLCIFLAVYKSRKLQTRGNAFLVCLASSDFLVSMFNVPFTAVSSVLPTLRPTSSLLCDFSGFFEMTFLIASVFSVTAINLHRFVHLIHWDRYYDICSTKRIRIAITFIWIAALILSAPPMLKLSKISYKQGKGHCFVDWRVTPTYTFALMILCFFVPVCIMAYCYYRIYKFRRDSRRKVKESTYSDKNASFTPTMSRPRNLTTLTEGTDIDSGIDSSDRERSKSTSTTLNAAKSSNQVVDEQFEKIELKELTFSFETWKESTSSNQVMDKQSEKMGLKETTVSTTSRIERTSLKFTETVADGVDFRSHIPTGRNMDMDSKRRGFETLKISNPQLPPLPNRISTDKKIRASFSCLVTENDKSKSIKNKKYPKETRVSRRKSADLFKRTFSPSWKNRRQRMMTYPSAEGNDLDTLIEREASSGTSCSECNFRQTNDVSVPMSLGQTKDLGQNAFVISDFQQPARERNPERNEGSERKNQGEVIDEHLIKIIVEEMSSSTREESSSGASASFQTGTSVKKTKNIKQKKHRINRTKREQDEDKKLTMMCLMIVAVFFMSWFPFVITMFIEALTSLTIPPAVDKSSLFIGYLNSLSNPFIYCYFNRTFRIQLKKLLCLNKGKK